MVSNRALVRIIGGLVLVLAVGTVFHEYRLSVDREYAVTQLIHDRASERLSMVAREMHTYALDGLAALQVLMSSLDVVDGVVAERIVATFVAEREDFYLVRYRAPDESVIEYGWGVAAFIEESDRIFNALEAIDTGEVGVVVAGAVVPYETATGERVHGVPVRINLRGGVLEAVFAIDPMFAMVRNAEQPGEDMLLVDVDGIYLVAHDGLLRSTESLFGEYADRAVATVFSEQRTGTFTTDGTFFAFRHVMTPGVRLGLSERQYWVLVLTRPEDAMLAQARNVGSYHAMNALLFMVVTGTLGLAVAVLVRRNKLYEAVD